MFDLLFRIIVLLVDHFDSVFSYLHLLLMSQFLVNINVFALFLSQSLLHCLQLALMFLFQLLLFMSHCKNVCIRRWNRWLLFGEHNFEHIVRHSLGVHPLRHLFWRYLFGSIGLLLDNPFVYNSFFVQLFGYLLLTHLYMIKYYSKLDLNCGNGMRSSVMLMVSSYLDPSGILNCTRTLFGPALPRKGREAPGCSVVCN